jgi:4-hydroxybenzoate polyprenyltransferase
MYTMKKKLLWPTVAIFAVFALGFVSALAAVRRPTAVEVMHTGPSAATSIIVFLFAVLGLMVGLGVAALVTWQVLRTREQTRRMKQAALLFGAKNTPTPRPRPAVHPGNDGGTVIMIGGGGQPYVEDMRQ